MPLDTSAVISILIEDPAHARLQPRLAAATVVTIGAPTLFEAALVLSNKLRRDPRSTLHRFLREMDVQVVPFTPEHYEIAVDAFERYGKGRHPAALNFGDCMTYAVA